jgi:integrase
MPLSDIQCKSAKPESKPYKLSDGNGLYLLINSVGKYWRYDYRYMGKRKTIPFGTYPAISLKQARQKLIDAKRQLADGIDPMSARKAEKQAAKERASQTFERIAREWHITKAGDWSEPYFKHVLQNLERYLFPVIGNRPIADISASELLKALDAIVQRGALETARRTRGNAEGIWAYAVVNQYADRNVAMDLRKILATPRVKHHASITEPEKVGQLLKAIEGYEGSLVVKCALRLLPYVFTRPGELRGMLWSEIDFDAALWVIPSERMKMREDHIVPLSKQAIEILREAQALTGTNEFVFPGERSRARPISNNTLNAALRRIGYSKDEMTAHGFRAMARTLLDEVLGFRIDFIEHQLAHAVRDPLGRAYNRTKHLDDRKRMMQAWADYLESLRNK